MHQASHLVLVALQSLLWDLLCIQAKDEHVVSTDLLCNLHIGTIHGSNDEAAVHHELHVASARGLCSSCGDLLRQLGACAYQSAQSGRLASQFQKNTREVAISPPSRHEAFQPPTSMRHG